MRTILPITASLALLVACQDGPTAPDLATADGLAPAPMPTAWHDIVVRDLSPDDATTSAAVAVDRAGVVLMRVEAAEPWRLVDGMEVRTVTALNDRADVAVAGMNDRLVTGTWTPEPGTRRPFAWDRETGDFLEPDLAGLPHVTAAEATALGSDGVVAGTAFLDDGGEAAFLWDASARSNFTLLPGLPGFSRCRALGLAAADLVVGACLDGSGAEAPVAWVDGEPAHLAIGGEAGGNAGAEHGARASAVNATGRIAGVATDAGGRRRLVVWRNANATATTAARINSPSVVAMTDAGWILGEGDDSLTGRRNAFLAADGTVSWLPGITGPASAVAAGNEILLVGSSAVGPEQGHAAAWTVDVVREPRLIIGRMARVVGRYAASDLVDESDARSLRASLDTALDYLLIGDDRVAIAVLREFIDQLERFSREWRMAATDARPLVAGAVAAITIIQKG